MHSQCSCECGYRLSAPGAAVENVQQDISNSVQPGCTLAVNVCEFFWCLLLLYLLKRLAKQKDRLGREEIKQKGRES